MGVKGVMIDVWWGLTELSPQTYRFDGYLRVAELARARGLHLQPIMSFHRCGGNVNDDCNITLPAWALSAAREHSLFYQDQWGYQNEEVLSLSADYMRVFASASGSLRTGLSVYEDFMRAFAKAFSGYLSDGTIDNVQVGLGPAGELRYPSYPSARWTYPGVGAFQAFDPQMLQSLRSAAKAAGHAEWNSPPTDAGSYNSTPSTTAFFKTGYSTDYGRFFLDWYQGQLMQHGKDLLKSAISIFGSTSVAGKIAGIHWWYGDNSHAAELTAGYYNANGNDAYEDFAQMMDTAHFDFTCLEMTDAAQAGCNCNSKPEELVRQAIDAVRHYDGIMAAENALNTYSQEGYDQILNQLRYGKGYLKAFTYLRLSSTLFEAKNWDLFVKFVADAAAV